MDVQLGINPRVRARDFTAIYAAQGCVQVPEFLEPRAAEALAGLVRTLPWRLVVQVSDEQNMLLTREQLSAMSPQELKQLDDGIRERAARGIGYTYLTYPLIQARIENWDPGHPMHDFTDFMNSGEVLDFARTLIGEADLTKVDAHASNYGPRHYLTRHVDEGAHGERRAAYTIGLSPDWDPDWGGLLLFFDDDFNVSRGLLPRFNTLTVFDGRLPHSVSGISAFAPRARISIAGWFRNDPPGA